MYRVSNCDPNFLNNVPIEQAVKLINGVPINREYDELIDFNQYVGWNTVTEWNPLTMKLFTKKTLHLIKNKTCEYLTGVHPEGKRIIPSDNVVITALLGVFKDHVPRTGDIYGKYLVVDPEHRDDYGYIVDKTISLLVQGIRTDIGMQEVNQKLNIWDATLLGDFNPYGLRQHVPIKVRNKRPDPMLFQMRY